MGGLNSRVRIRLAASADELFRLVVIAFLFVRNCLIDRTFPHIVSDFH